MHAIEDIFSRLGLERAALANGDLEVRTPITGELLAHLYRTNEAGTDAAVASAAEAFETWRDVPAPRRGELVRLLGEELRREKEALGALVTLETGKIAQEGLGEVQEMIDICDLAVGLSRQLFGRTIASERPGHRMLETWRDVPAPRRGELVRLLGEELRREKEALGALVTLETGKIAQEG
ncbi:MAG TPA: aldehyde dehydrogenase family protein, partial [Gaiellales bacterium]|nr:aldehyde dehydrogenase family protein [Gaiellales bacterium]